MIIFYNLVREEDFLWAQEQLLNCNQLTPLPIGKGAFLRSY